MIKIATVIHGRTIFILDDEAINMAEKEKREKGGI